MRRSVKKRCSNVAKLGTAFIARPPSVFRGDREHVPSALGGRCGASLPEIGQILDHRNPETTAIYAEVWPIEKSEDTTRLVT
jgi:hypothetical protein